MIRVSKPALLCDTGLLSRAFLAQPPFLDAYQMALERYQETISMAVYIELQHLLLLQRGLAEPISGLSTTATEDGLIPTSS